MHCTFHSRKCNCLNATDLTDLMSHLRHRSFNGNIHLLNFRLSQTRILQRFSLLHSQEHIFDTAKMQNPRSGKVFTTSTHLSAKNSTSYETVSKRRVLTGKRQKNANNEKQVPNLKQHSRHPSLCPPTSLAPISFFLLPQKIVSNTSDDSNNQQGFSKSRHQSASIVSSARKET